MSKLHRMTAQYPVSPPSPPKPPPHWQKTAEKHKSNLSRSTLLHTEARVSPGYSVNDCSISSTLIPNAQCPDRGTGPLIGIMGTLIGVLRWPAGYLGLALAFVWNSAQREKFRFCFSRVFS